MMHVGFASAFCIGWNDTIAAMQLSTLHKQWIGVEPQETAFIGMC